MEVVSGRLETRPNVVIGVNRVFRAVTMKFIMVQFLQKELRLFCRSVCHVVKVIHSL